MNKIKYARQDINEADIEEVISVLRSDWLTQGPMLPKFEAAITNYCEAKYAVGVNSATSALHIACLALDVGPGDYVWTSAITFVASANCALYCGASVDFVDIDPETSNLSVQHLHEKLRDAENIGKLPKVLIPVHLNGQSCDMAGIYTLSKKYGFKIIEDASHAIGGKYKSKPIGNCLYSDITVFSFHPVKIITTTEGGMAVTNNQYLENRLKLFRSHGITSTPEEMTLCPNNEIWNYQQIELGYNYRMTEIQAALGISQIKRLDEFVKKRHKIASRYDHELIDLPVSTPSQHKDSYSAFHLYPVQVEHDNASKTQLEVYESMRGSNILVNLHYIPVYRQPFYKSLGFKKGYCQTAEKYFKSTISIPMYPSLSKNEQTSVIRSLIKAFK
jgi:UDP-4-amino-4,6-dideoxy-N-acetyl-beta-L-altrosamine transaminase